MGCKIKELIKGKFFFMFFVLLYRDVVRFLIIKRNAFKWRTINYHNSTSLSDVLFPANVKVGNFSYGKLNVVSWGVDGEGLFIGNYVSIADNVTFILGGNHTINGCCTFPLKSYKYKKQHVDDAKTKGPIVVEDDVWIGYGSIILSGVSIGRGAVIAAGSVITKNVPCYSIVAGNPARVVKMRLTPEQIDICSKFNFGLVDLNSLSDDELNSLYLEP